MKKFFKIAAAIVLVLIVAVLVIRFKNRNLQVVLSMNMAPTIIGGDTIHFDRDPFLVRSPERGEIVIYQPPDSPSFYIGRIVGIPKDNIEIKKNQLFVNGVSAQRCVEGTQDGKVEGHPVSYDIIREELDGHQYQVWLMQGSELSGDHNVPVVKEDEYFIMGDNRNNSADSRSFGSVKKSNILGTVTEISNSLDSRRVGRILDKRK